MLVPPTESALSFALFAKGGMQTIRPRYIGSYHGPRYPQSSLSGV